MQDVVIVGGGLAGLVAARAVVAAGRSVTVVEARESTGGRLQACSLGALGKDTPALGALADELGLRLRSLSTGVVVDGELLQRDRPLATLRRGLKLAATGRRTALTEQLRTWVEEAGSAQAVVGGGSALLAGLRAGSSRAELLLGHRAVALRMRRDDVGVVVVDGPGGTRELDGAVVVLALGGAGVAALQDGPMAFALQSLAIEQQPDPRARLVFSASLRGPALGRAQGCGFSRWLRLDPWQPQSAARAGSGCVLEVQPVGPARALESLVAELESVFPELRGSFCEGELVAGPPVYGAPPGPSMPGLVHGGAWAAPAADARWSVPAHGFERAVRAGLLAAEAALARLR